MLLRSSLFLLFFSCFLQLLVAQSTPGVYVIFDASGSMWGRLEDQSYKIHTARQVLKDFVKGNFQGRELALRVYGHRREKDCSDSELMVPFGPAEQVIEPFTQAIEGINPKGRTPISYSLRQALQDFGDRQGDIILISDGIETCNEDPCALMREWREKNINIKVHVVGFGVEEKAKLALQCIADAAGTPYHGAGSSEELSKSLSEIQERKERTVLTIEGIDEDGQSWPINGYLLEGDERVEEQDLKSGFKHDVLAGTYTLVAGIQTRNGNLYKPVRKEITLPPKEYTHEKITVILPPRVSSKFMDGDQQEHGSLVSAYQKGKEVFRFRPFDEVFLDEGSYEFRASPDSENELSVTESFRAGDRKELLFQMVHAVRVYIRYTNEEKTNQLGRYIELYQNGEQAYRMTSHNGGLVLPGTYEVKSGDYFAPLPTREIIVTAEEKQEFDLLISTGTITFSYQKPDGSPDKDDRVFVSYEGKSKRLFQNSGKAYVYPPGIYQVSGWKQKGNYDPVVFEVVAGKEKTITLRAK